MAKKNIESKIGQNKEQEQESKFAGYWKRFNFRGLPPRVDTPVEQRLEEKCIKYANSMLDAQIGGAIGQRYRRELHDEISLMVYGKNRNDLDDQSAQNIVDFASLVTTGMVMEDALEKFRESLVKDSSKMSVSQTINQFRNQKE